MAVDIHKLIAAVNPDLYCNASVKDEVKKIVKESLAKGEKDAYIKAAEKAKSRDVEPINYVKFLYRNPMNFKSALKHPFEKHKLVYDSFGENLEPLYFWILDAMESQGFKVDKLIDNFVSSPGSGHFSEMGQKASRMQEEAMKMLGAANNVIKSILNILYDLKEFKIRLGLYDKLKSTKPEEKESAMLSLKQIWLDTVDQKRGNSSIKGMALTQANFVTLIDAFMAIENEKLDFKGSEIDLNDRVKRILKQRVGEFYLWIKESEIELRKRYNIEKIYLKSQYNTVQLYSRWAKPYLQAARNLEQNAPDNPSLVRMFNTTMFELMLFGKSNYDINNEVAKGELPKMFKDSNKRNYGSVIIVQLNFRSTPERAGQNYGFRGRAEITFTGYALNDDETKLVKEQMDKDNVGEVFKMIESTTKDSLGNIQAEIDEFLDENPKEKSEEDAQEESQQNDVNPFTELFNFFKSSKPEEKKDEKNKTIKPDSDMEKVIRAQSVIDARQRTVRFYEIYKKGHQMVSFGTLDDVY